jgi:hypothetical protein
MKVISFLIIQAALGISVEAQSCSGKTTGYNKGDPDMRTAFPDKVKTANPSENPPIPRIASYFY